MQEAIAHKRTGADLVALREEYGVDQGAVAEQLGKSRQTVYRWERPTSTVTPFRWLTYKAACERALVAAAGGTAA